MTNYIYIATLIFLTGLIYAVSQHSIAGGLIFIAGMVAYTFALLKIFTQ